MISKEELDIRELDAVEKEAQLKRAAEEAKRKAEFVDNPDVPPLE